MTTKGGSFRPRSFVLRHSRAFAPLAGDHRRRLLSSSVVRPSSQPCFRAMAHQLTGAQSQATISPKSAQPGR